MSSRVAYPYPEWVHEARFQTDIISRLSTHTIAKATPRSTLLAQCSKTVLYTLLERSDRALVYTLPGHSLADWGIMANGLYQAFYTP